MHAKGSWLQIISNPWDPTGVMSLGLHSTGVHPDLPQWRRGIGGWTSWHPTWEKLILLMAELLLHVGDVQSRVKMRMLQTTWQLVLEFQPFIVQYEIPMYHWAVESLAIKRFLQISTLSLFLFSVVDGSTDRCWLLSRSDCFPHKYLQSAVGKVGYNLLLHDAGASPPIWARMAGWCSF